MLGPLFRVAEPLPPVAHHHKDHQEDCGEEDYRAEGERQNDAGRGHKRVNLLLVACHVAKMATHEDSLQHHAEGNSG